MRGAAGSPAHLDQAGTVSRPHFAESFQREAMLTPDAFDIFRTARQHMAFAFGPHRCLGMHLARMETRVVINAVLDRLPNVRLDPAALDVHITGRAFRAPRSLPVLFG